MRRFDPWAWRFYAATFVMMLATIVWSFVEAHSSAEGPSGSAKQHLAVTPASQEEPGAHWSRSVSARESNTVMAQEATPNGERE
jgi:hypothetical protein